MQVRQVLVASLLAVSAIAAMSRETDPNQELQGSSQAAQTDRSADSPKASEPQQIQAKPRSKARFDLTRWHPKHKAVVGEQG